MEIKKSIIVVVFALFLLISSYKAVSEDGIQINKVYDVKLFSVSPDNNEILVQNNTYNYDVLKFELYDFSQNNDTVYNLSIDSYKRNGIIESNYLSFSLKVNTDKINNIFLYVGDKYFSWNNIFIGVEDKEPIELEYVEPKYDLKIISRRSDSFYSPAIEKSGSFVYKNVTFYMYDFSGNNNTQYYIKVENITVLSGVMPGRYLALDYTLQNKSIKKIEIVIGSWRWQYYYIFLLPDSVENIIEKAEKKIWDLNFMKSEFREKINVIQWGVYRQTLEGFILLSILSLVVVKIIKSYRVYYRY